eukprot:COSAG03_NODE_706_length_6183_cov_8.640861_4_plen_57_part_00
MQGGGSDQGVRTAARTLLLARGAFCAHAAPRDDLLVYMAIFELQWRSDSVEYQQVG